MKILYDLGILLYTAGIYVYSLFNGKAKLWISGRKGVFNRLALAGFKDKKVVWFHAASLGEFEQGRPVIEKFRKDFPGYTILLTFFSPSGYEVRKNYAGADHIFYLPADTSMNAGRFVAIVRPVMAVFIKYEFWLNYLNSLYRNDIPVISISAIFREDQYYFRWYGAFALKRLMQVSAFFVQNDASVRILKEFGIEQVILSGDTRFDRVAELKADNKRFYDIEQLISGRDVFLAGSSWEPDENIIEPLIREYPDVLFVFAPHEVHEKRINSLVLRLSSFGIVKYSGLDGRNPESARVLIIDTIGILSHLYKYAKLAYIGGGFGRGIHNILEAATFGKPIVFGPQYSRFSEARELVELGGAFPVMNADELLKTVAGLLKDPEKFSEASKICVDYTVQKQGATELIIDGMGRILSSTFSRKKG